MSHEPGAAAGQTGPAPRRARRGWATWVVIGCYALGAIALTARLWADPAGLEQAGNAHDIDLFLWFMRHDAVAVSHGRLPALVTTAMNAPQGINLMWNTSLLLPGLLLAPLTLAAGPQTALTVLLAIGFAGSAASLFSVLRRWQASVGAAALGGAVYGFSPALLGTAVGHYHLQFAVLPPLIADLSLGIVTGRRRAARSGLWLGLLASAQVFISEELLAITAVAVAVLIAALAAGQRRAVRAQVRGAVTGFAATAAVTLAICGYPLWVQFLGPLHQHGSPWPAWGFRNSPAAFVTPSGGLILHTAASAAAATHFPHYPQEYLAYLGWPLLIVLPVATIRFWADARIRAAAVTWAALETFSLGSRPVAAAGLTWPAAALPWHWLALLPVVGDVLPDRFSIVADGAAAAALAFALDAARRISRERPHGWTRRAAPAAVAVLAMLPLLPLPLAATGDPQVPAGWGAVFTRLDLPPQAPVLVIPGTPAVLAWQAETGQPGSLIGGRCIAPDPAGQARACATGKRATALYLTDLWRRRPASRPSRALVRADLAYWEPAAVVAVARRPHSPLMRALIRVFGPPTFRVGHLLAWRRQAGWRPPGSGARQG